MSESVEKISTPLIYNLFPRLGGHIGRWEGHFRRAAAMGFDWIYFNPLFYPGFSGSVYAVKDFRRLDPLICPPGHEDLSIEEIRSVLAAARAAGLKPMIDLVINHTAKDSELVGTHPEWYSRDEQGEVQSPWAIDPADARKRTVWGDLAELDHEGTLDRDGLKAFVKGVVEACLEVGFEGFRCDAAYKIPTSTWAELTALARSRRGQTMFVAETLGCRIEEALALQGAGFDYVMNSSKYWAFDAPWAIEQHGMWQQIAPSISFPESHDTPRLAVETGGLEHVQRQRFVLAATFSEGLLMPMGFEFGFKKKLNVVTTRESDWEDPAYDIAPFIAGVLRLKRGHSALGAEGKLEALTSLDAPTLFLQKSTPDDRAVLIINKDWHGCHEVDLGWLYERGGSGSSRLVRPCLDSFEPESMPKELLLLEPAEIAIMVS